MFVPWNDTREHRYFYKSNLSKESLFHNHEMRGFLGKEIKSNAGEVIKSYPRTLLVAFVNSYNVFESHGKPNPRSSL